MGIGTTQSDQQYQQMYSLLIYNYYVPNKAREGRVDICLSNSFGMGGQNCCPIIKSFK